MSSDGQLSSSAVSRLLMEALAHAGRAVALLYPVYLTGYLGLSVSWVLLCMLLLTWWRKNRQWKDRRIGTAIDFVDQETRVIDRELQGALQMASWVRDRTETCCGTGSTVGRSSMSRSEAARLEPCCHDNSSLHLHE